MDRDLALIERLERLYPAVVADCLDRLGGRTEGAIIDMRENAHEQQMLRLLRADTAAGIGHLEQQEPAIPLQLPGLNRHGTPG